ncbi:lactonase family protein [Rhizobium sp. BT03]|uniref:lactonase family protein n=1 Tax=Rhizobium sp. BT03 TaxID=3045156 RepID=UPI0024B3DD9A|nr:lactonase family protein [Rhizobium sp. BT03]WHO72391.1 lactonase family protein [Rhizobium sp. BT03]
MKLRSGLVAYVGARTTRTRNARGNGLNVYRLGPVAEWTHVQLLEMENPSFLAFDRSGCFLYTVHGDADRVSAFAVDRASGELVLLNEQSTGGRNPVHLSFDPANRFLVVANHVTSSLALMPRNEDGTIGALCDLAGIVGEVGPHRAEQPFPKPHQVEFDPSGRWIVVPDKGIDQILVYEIDAGALKAVSTCPAREGAGPRHVAFHPAGDLAYVVNELDSTVAAYRFDARSGRLTPFQIVSALDESFTGNSRAAEIAVSPDGRFVYASNRGSDTIAAFAIDDAGALKRIGSWPTAGRTPRFFTLLEDGVLLAANEDSDTITAFDIDAASGSLVAKRATLSVGSPVCILVKELR